MSDKGESTTDDDEHTSDNRYSCRGGGVVLGVRVLLTIVLGVGVILTSMRIIPIMEMVATGRGIVQGPGFTSLTGDTEGVGCRSITDDDKYGPDERYRCRGGGVVLDGRDVQEDHIEHDCCGRERRLQS